MVDSTNSTLTNLTRLGAAAVGTALGYSSVSSLYRILGSPEWASELMFGGPITLLLATLSAFGWWFALRGDRVASRAAMRAGWRGARWIGGLGFVLGFVGPLLLWPDANMGPLLGFIVTGPLGFVVGALAGVMLRAAKLKEASEGTQ